MKLCRDCKWAYFPPYGGEYAKCTHPDRATEDYVCGRVYCSVERGHGACGTEGKHWEAAPPKLPSWWMRLLMRATALVSGKPQENVGAK